MDGENCFIWNKSLQPNKSSHTTGWFAVPFGGAPTTNISLLHITRKTSPTKEDGVTLRLFFWVNEKN